MRLVLKNSHMCLRVLSVFFARKTQRITKTSLQGRPKLGRLHKTRETQNKLVKRRLNRVAETLGISIGGTWGVQGVLYLASSCPVDAKMHSSRGWQGVCLVPVCIAAGPKLVKSDENVEKRKKS